MKNIEISFRLSVAIFFDHMLLISHLIDHTLGTYKRFKQKIYMSYLEKKVSTLIKNWNEAFMASKYIQFVVILVSVNAT